MCILHEVDDIQAVSYASFHFLDAKKKPLSVSPGVDVAIENEVVFTWTDLHSSPQVCGLKLPVEAERANFCTHTGSMRDANGSGANRGLSSGRAVPCVLGCECPGMAEGR